MARDETIMARRGDIYPHLIADDRISVPVWRVVVKVIGAAEKVPADVFAFAYRERANSTTIEPLHLSEAVQHRALGRTSLLLNKKGCFSARVSRAR